MQITVVTDNCLFMGTHHYYAEHGLCFYIEADDKRFFFDVGNSGLFSENAEKLNVDWKNVDGIILSHSHHDHTLGLGKYLDFPSERKLDLYAHPGALHRVCYEGKNIGCSYSEQQLSSVFNIHLSEEPMQITPHLLLLGEIPTSVDFEPRYALGVCEDTGEADYIREDTALVYTTTDGIYIITGCSHSGICNIIAYAKKMTGIDNIKGVIGGFHLTQIDERSLKTIAFLKAEGIQDFYPCHCTAFPVRAKMFQALPVNDVGVGLVVNWK